MADVQEEVTVFSTWDYVVFAIVLAISAGMGIYQAIKMRLATKNKGVDATTEYLLAGRSMSAVPVALSILASFFSASTLLGTPAEIYRQDTMYWLAAWSSMVAPLIGAYLFGPFFHRMKILSVFEYLEKRYNSVAVRLLGAAIFILRATLGMGIVMFGPAVALSAVTPFPVWATIVVIGVLCAFYTALGGMKAVIWTDVFQTVIMLAGVLAIIIQGSIEVGGISRAWSIAVEGNRVHFFDFDPDPTVRHTFWTLIIGNIFVWLPPYTVDQQMMQRFSSTKTLRHAVGSLLLNMPGMFIIITLTSLAGLIMFAYYAECDPLTRGIISDPNQLMPRFCMDIFGWAPGMPGLFVASLFSGALSSVSSMLNSLAAVTWHDFCLLSSCARSLSDGQATLVNKLLAILFAAIGIGMAFVFSQIGGTVLQMSIAFNGAAGAPLVGLFILGAFFPWVNWIGACVGAVLGFAMPMWISIGAYVTSPPVSLPMNFSVAGCPVQNSSSIYDNTTESWFTTEFYTQDPPPSYTVEGIVRLYTLSYLWYTAVGILVTVFVGLLVSFATGYTRPKDVDPELLISYVDKMWCCFPTSCRQHCRCGVDFQQPNEMNGSAYSAGWMPEEKGEMNIYSINFSAVCDDDDDNDSLSKQQTVSTFRDLSL